MNMANLFMGIAINTGDVAVGTLGSDIYREFTAIGSDVNLVSRIEPYCLRGQVILSENSYEQAKDYIEIGNVNDIMVKGLSKPAIMYELLAITKPTRIEVPIRDVRKSPRVKVNVPLNFHRLQGKQVLPEVCEGNIIDISYGGCLIHTNEELEAYSEIKVAVSLSLMGISTGEIYAKVLRSKKVDNSYRSHVEFTAFDDDARRAIKGFVDGLI